MDYYVISDLHLGSKHSQSDKFLEFLKSIPGNGTLVLNGDTLNRRKKYFGEKEETVIRELAALSVRTKIIWLDGNHDKKHRPDNYGSIIFMPFLSLGDIMISHGHTFDIMMRMNRPFVWIFMFSHWFLNLFKAESMHVSAFAKRFKFLYTLLRNHVKSNAVSFAAKNGFKTMICGHTHFCEDVMIDGIRFVNTGSWLEMPAHFAVIRSDGSVSLQQFKC